VGGFEDVEVAQEQHVLSGGGGQRGVAGRQPLALALGLFQAAAVLVPV
jgi:hypothetical protein